MLFEPILLLRLLRKLLLAPFWWPFWLRDFLRARSARKARAVGGSKEKVQGWMQPLGRGFRSISGSLHRDRGRPSAEVMRAREKREVLEQERDAKQKKLDELKIRLEVAVSRLHFPPAHHSS